MYFNGLKFSGVLEQLSYTQKDFGLKCKNRLFEEKRVLSVDFIALKCKWLQNGLIDLKNNKHLKFT